ncbi:MAG: hypothetical protein LBD93_04440 [Treponema sp.]|jgi:hypothetical protein|nr:hypothetical protein [Treponema sp.]
MMMRMVKKASGALGMMVLGGLLWSACNQDPIFYSISLEVEPVDPRIVGRPTAMVYFDGALYATSIFSKTIHRYYDGSWENLSETPGSAILALAATTTRLYALAGEPGAAQLYYATNLRGSKPLWKDVASTPGYSNIQSIYGAGDQLFVGAMLDADTFAMLYVQNDNLTLLEGGKGFLRGAAYTGDAYYLAGEGLYILEGKNLSPVPSAEGYIFSGLIALEDKTLVGVSGKTLVTVSPEGNLGKKDMGVTFTGALALWGAEPEEKKLLLLGIQGASTSTTHGYRELLLNAEGGLDAALSIRIPGKEALSSVSDYEKYNSSIGKHPAIALMQAPDGILFAGTTKNGLWSYRDEQWNAEP